MFCCLHKKIVVYSESRNYEHGNKRQNESSCLEEIVQIVQVWNHLALMLEYGFNE